MGSLNSQKIIEVLQEGGVDDRTIQKFLGYLKDNREAWGWFCQFALAAKSMGSKKIGAKMVAERVRWESEIVRATEFKINNSYVAYMARIAEVKHPELKGMFEFRNIKGLSAEDVSGEVFIYDRQARHEN